MVPELTAAEILEAALKLSPEERGALASSLIASLEDDPPDPDAEAAWEAEISRRVREIEAGTARLIPWTEARRMLMGE